MTRKRKKKVIGTVNIIFIINLKWHCIFITVVIIDVYTTIYTFFNGIDFTKLQF
jgi:hypothetical protein